MLQEGSALKCSPKRISNPAPGQEYTELRYRGRSISVNPTSQASQGCKVRSYHKNRKEGKKKEKKKNQLPCPRGKIRPERAALWLGCFKANVKKWSQETLRASLLPPTSSPSYLSRDLAGSARGFLQRLHRSSQQETVHAERKILANPCVKCLTLTISFNPRELF